MVTELSVTNVQLVSRQLQQMTSNFVYEMLWGTFSTTLSVWRAFLKLTKDNVLLLTLFTAIEFLSVAVVLTLVQTKQIRINIVKEIIQNTIQKIKNGVNTSTRIMSTKTSTRLSKHPHITKQVKTTTVQDTYQIK